MNTKPIIAVLLFSFCGQVLAQETQVTVTNLLEVNAALGQSGIPASLTKLIQGKDGKLYGVAGTGTYDGIKKVFSYDLQTGEHKEVAELPGTVGSAGSLALDHVQNASGAFFIGAEPISAQDGVTPASTCPSRWNHLESGVLIEERINWGGIYKYGADGSVDLLPVSKTLNICPSGPMAVDSSNNIYFFSAPSENGTTEIQLMKISADETTMEVVRTFNVATDGYRPAALLAGEDDWMYGIFGLPIFGDGTRGSIFRIKPSQPDSFQVLVKPSSTTVGGVINSLGLAPLTEVGDWLYIAGAAGGPNFNSGTVFRVKKDGSAAAADNTSPIEVLFAFDRSNNTVNGGNGWNAIGDLVLAGDGNLYGVTTKGATDVTNSVTAVGSVYRILLDSQNDDAQVQPLFYVFDTAKEGGTPLRHGLTAARNGKLYVGAQYKSNADKYSLNELDIGYVPQGPVFNNFSTNPAQVEWIGSAQAVATLTWDVSNASLCTASGAWTGTKAAAGIEQVVPAQLGDNVYTLTCDNGSGLENAVSVQSVTVVAVEPAVSSSSSSSAPASFSSEASVSAISSSEAISSSSSSSEVIASSSSSSEAIASSSSSSEIIASSSSSSAVVVSSSSSSEAIATSSSSSETIASSSASSEIVVSSSSTPVVIVSSSSTSSAPVSSSASSIPASSSSSSSVVVSSSSVAVSSSSSSATVIESNKSGGGGAMNLWWMLSLCLLALGRRVKV